MQKSTTTPIGKENVPESKSNPTDGLPPANENIHDTHKEEVKEEVKESFKDEDVPVEPAIGDDGDEVGGEG